MTPDPTVPISVEYLVEFTDDAEQPDQGVAEVVILPPLPGANLTCPPTRPSEQEPRP